MLDFKIFGVIKDAGWSIDEIQNFSNFYDEFIKTNEPDFTLFMNFLKIKGFNKTADELVDIYTKYKSSTPIKMNIDFQEKVEERVEGKQKNLINVLNGYKGNLKKLQNKLENEKDPNKQAELNEKIKIITENIQTLTNVIERLKTKHGTMEPYQRNVDMDRYYRISQVENVQVAQTRMIQSNQPIYNKLKITQIEKDKKWMEKHKKGFILNKLDSNLKAKKEKNQEKTEYLLSLARELKKAEFSYGRNSEEYKLIAQQYLEMQKEALGKRMSKKIERELGKEYILKSGNHIEIPDFLLNIVGSKTR